MVVLRWTLNQLDRKLIAFMTYIRPESTLIYIITSSDFQAATSEKNFINILNEAKEKHLGTYKKSTLKTERITHSLFSNNEVSLIYFSEYSKRIVQEIFVFELEGKKVKLKSYRYDSIN